MKHKNWFWGTFLLVAAIFVIVSQVGGFIHIGFWSIAATVLLTAVFVSSLVYLNFFGIFIPLSLLYLIYQKPVNLPEISPWLLILAAFLASLGLSILFHSPLHRRHWKHCDWNDKENKWDKYRDKYFSENTENIDGNDIFVKSSFSESCKYLHADSLKKAKLSSSFGKLSVYFDQVQLSPEGAEAYLDVSFGDMTLFLPKHWHVVEKVHASVGAVDSDFHGAPADQSMPTLTLSGSVSFGHLGIHYV